METGDQNIRTSMAKPGLRVTQVTTGYLWAGNEMITLAREWISGESQTKAGKPVRRLL